jgi:hypothetical protein
MVNNNGILDWIQKNQVRTNKGLPIEFRDHGFLLDYVKDPHNRIVVRKCTHPDTKILRVDLKWVAIKDIQPGDSIVGFEEQAPKGRGNRRHFEESIVYDKWTIRKQAFKLILEDGRSIIASEDHPFLGMMSRGKIRNQFAWHPFSEYKVGDSLRVIFDVWESGHDYESGWMAGLMDGEGSLKVARKSGGSDFVISQHPNGIADRAEAYLKYYGFKYHVRDDEHKDRCLHRNDKIRRLVLSRTSEIIRLIGQTQPTRWIESKFWKGLALGMLAPKTKLKIISIKPVGEIDLIDIQTSSRTFIAEGIATHNCTQVGASFSTNVKMVHLGSQAPLTTIYCVDPKTEIMTENGWRFYYDLKVDDKIITLNMSTGKSEWKPLKEVFVKTYDGEMISWEGRNISALSTPDHKWPVHKGDGKFFFKQTQEINQSTLFIPKTVNYNNQQTKKYSNDFVQLFSWIYTEGCYPKSESKGKVHRKLTRVVITQSYKINKKYCDEIEGLLNRMKIPYRCDVLKFNGCNSYTIKGEIPFKIRSLFPYKKPTAEFIRSLTKEQLEIFIDTSIKADGWTDKFGTKAFIQKDKDIIDIFSLACVLAGYPISIQKRNSHDDCYVVRIIKYKNIYTNQIGRAGKKVRIQYSGIVWCPSTDNGTFLAKRNHTVYWTGNTLPTSSEAKNFVLTKFDPMIERSPGLLEMVKKVVLRERVLYNSVVKRIGPSYYFFRGCVDDKTEILTCRGWQKHYTMREGEAIPTVNMKTKEIEVQKVNKLHKYDVDEDLLRFKNRTVDMLLTKDHRCLLESRRTGKLLIKRARNVKSRSSDYIPMHSNGYHDGADNDVAFSKILGWVVGDGTYWTERCKKKLKHGMKVYKYPRVNIIQKKNCIELEDDLDNAGISFYIKKGKDGVNIYSLSRSASKKIKKALPSKKMPIESLFKMSSRSLNGFYNGLMASDGSKRNVFYQLDVETMDMFQVLVSLIGKSSNVTKRKKGKMGDSFGKKDKYTAFVREKKRSNKFTISEQRYKGVVWCPETDNGTIIIRRNGKVQLTGQSWTTWGAQSIDADVLVVDELDFQKPDVRQMWEERTEGSASQDIIFWIGYPSIPNYGIEELYENSDKRMWFIECPHCKKRQVLEFPDNIDMEREVYVCKFCKGELSDDDRRKGIWKITQPGKDIHGYWINKLMAPWIPASKIINRFKKDTPKKFHNYTLGLPYVSKETELSDSVIQKSMIEEQELTLIKAEEECKVLCGIDQGDIFHMLIAIVTERNIVVTNAEQLRTEKDVLKRLNFFKPDMVVMDMFPNRHTAKSLCKDYGVSKFFMAKERNWTETSKDRTYWNLNRATSEVGIERTESIDAMIEYIMKGIIKFRRTLPRLMNHDKKDPGVIQQLKNLVPDTQERNGRMRRVFKAVGPEHYGHALNFIVTAAHIVFPGWQSRRALIPSSYLDELRNKKKPKPWYVKDFEDRIRGLNPHDAIIIKPGGEIIEPDDEDFGPRVC